MKSCILIALFIAASAGLAKADDLFPASDPSGRQYDDGGVKFMFDLSITYVDLGCRVNNVPLDIRNQGNLGPINTLQYNCNDNFNVGLLAIWQMDENHIGLNLGLGVDWIGTPLVGLGATEATRNNTNSAAQTNYVGMRVGGIFPSFDDEWTDSALNIAPRATVEIGPYGVDGPLWIGLSLSYFTVDLQSGWDDGEDLEPRHNFPLAYVFPIRLYATVFVDHDRNFGITGGVQFQPDFETGLARSQDSHRAGDILCGLIDSRLVNKWSTNMNNFTFHNPVKIVFGKGSIAQLADLVPKNANMMMTYGGGTIKTNGVYDQVKEALKGRTWIEFGGIEPNPEYETILKGAELARKNKIDFLLSVGGGSALDGTKFMAAIIPYKGENPWDIMERKAQIGDALPFGCVLTLPATGSEMNRFTVISRHATGQKIPLNHEKLARVFSILDPETTYTLPARQIRNGIIDAWMHCVEQYLTYPVDAPLQDRQAEAVLQTLLEEGPKAIKNPRDYNVRANIMWCATHALNGVFSCGTVSDWTTHRMGHELTALFGLDHAQTLAILFPAVMRHEKAGKLQKLAQYGQRVFGIKDTPERTAELAIDKTEEFMHSIGMKTRLSDYGIAASEIPKITAKFTTRDKLGERQTIGVKEIVEILSACA